MRIKWNDTLPDGYNAMKTLQSVADKSKLDPKLKELIKIRASQLNGCAYCLDMHTKDARALGETEQRIYLLPAWRETTLYSDPERAALAWCESLTLISRSGAPEKVYNELVRLFQPEEIVELTFAIVAINGWNRLSVAFRSDPGSYISDKMPL